MQKKLEWLECVRGGAILLVVLGHISLISGDKTISNFIYQFHMPLYFSISGFLYGYKEIENGMRTGAFLRKKFVGLGIPYLMFSLLYIGLNAFLQNYIQTNTKVSVQDMLYLFVKPVAHYWFLWVLIVYFILVALVGKTGKQLIALTAVGAVLALLAGTYIQLHIPAHQDGIMYFLYFSASALAGIAYRKRGQEMDTGIRLFVAFGVSASCFTVFSVKILDVGYDALQDICVRWFGIIAFSTLVMIVTKMDCIKKIFVCLGHYSWYIYLLHSYFLCLIRALLSRMIPKGNGFAEIMLGLCISVLSCILIGAACKKMKWPDYVFYPQRK